jgi:hypothetical protein
MGLFKIAVLKFTFFKLLIFKVVKAFGKTC